MRRRVEAWGVAALLGLGLSVPVAFAVVLYHKERDDRFCIACHLHEEKFERFLALPTATDLAGAHHAGRGPVPCIGCHGGADPGMQLRVWGLAALDTLRFLAGRYEEPERMRLPLRDAECQQCHDPIVRVSLEEEAIQEGRGDTYHAIAEHRTVETACVACHTSHTRGEKRFQFLDRRIVLPLCRSCHEWIGEEGSG